MFGSYYLVVICMGSNIIIGKYESLDNSFITEKGYVVLDDLTDRSFFIPVEKGCTIAIYRAMQKLASDNPELTNFNYEITTRKITLKPKDFIDSLCAYNKSEDALNDGAVVLEELKHINPQSIYPPPSGNIVLIYLRLNENMCEAFDVMFRPRVDKIFATGTR